MFHQSKFWALQLCRVGDHETFFPAKFAGMPHTISLQLALEKHSSSVLYYESNLYYSMSTINKKCVVVKFACYLKALLHEGGSLRLGKICSVHSLYF